MASWLVPRSHGPALVPGAVAICQLAIYLLAICCLFLAIVIYMLYNIFYGGFPIPSFLSYSITFGVSVLHIPLNWGLQAENHIFTEILVGTPTAVLLHRRGRILFRGPQLCHLAISAFYNLGLFRWVTKHGPYHQYLQSQKG